MMQLDNMSRPSQFKSTLKLIEYIRDLYPIKVLLNGIGTSAVKAVLFPVVFYQTNELINGNKSHYE